MFKYSMCEIRSRYFSLFLVALHLVCYNAHSAVVFDDKVMEKSFEKAKNNKNSQFRSSGIVFDENGINSSGTLIDPQTVLVAAHSFVCGGNIKNFFILSPEVQQTSPTSAVQWQWNREATFKGIDPSQYSEAEVIFHPEYKRALVGGAVSNSVIEHELDAERHVECGGKVYQIEGPDLAILKLKTPVRLPKGVNFLELNSSPELLAGKWGYSVGYGKHFIFSGNKFYNGRSVEKDLTRITYKRAFFTAPLGYDHNRGLLYSKFDIHFSKKSPFDGLSFFPSAFGQEKSTDPAYFTGYSSPGDSGGAKLVQLDNREWEIAGVTSRLIQTYNYDALVNNSASFGITLPIFLEPNTSIYNTFTAFRPLDVEWIKGSFGKTRRQILQETFGNAKAKSN